MPRLAPRMFPLPTLLLCLPMLAQGPRFPGRTPTLLTSLTRGADAPRLWLRNLTLPEDWARGDAQFLLLWGDECFEDTPSSAQVDALWGAEGWDPAEPRSVLVDGRGRKLASWAGLPHPTDVLEALRNTGWRPHHERLEAFIRDHPDQAQARAARITTLFGRLLRLDEPRDAELSAATASTLMESLRELRADPSWVDHAPVLAWCGFLNQFAKRKTPPFPEEDLRPLKEEIANAILRNPYDTTLWFAWSEILSRPEEVQVLMDRLISLPGDPLIPGGAAMSVIQALARLGAGSTLETLAERMLTARPAFPSQVQSRWRAARVTALFLQDRKAEGFRQLQSDLEQQPEVGFWVLSFTGFPGEINPLSDTERKHVMELLNARGPRRERPTPSEPSPVLRLDLAGNPAWTKAASPLPGHSAFDEWGVAELAWGTLDDPAWAALRARQDWGPEGRWVLHRGEELLASGTELPTASALSDRMRDAGAPLLAQLRILLKLHPELTAARRRRLRILQTRMPHPRLELLLMEDAATLQEPFLFPADLAEKLQKPLWEGAARRVLPELEAQLQHWPEDSDTWKAWLDWTHMVGKGDVQALMARLDLVPTTPTEEGPLPYRLASDLAEHLKAQGRSTELAAWGRPFWPHLLAQLPAALEGAKGATRRPPARGEGFARWEAAQEASTRLQHAQSLLRAWVEALRGTRATAEADAVAQALDALQPGLALRFLGAPEKPAKAPSRAAPPRP